MHITQSKNIVATFAVVLHDAIQRATERSIGLSGEAPSALTAIAAEPGMTIDMLRRAIDLTHPGAVRVVDRLVDRGWVVRERAGGRSVALRLTESGQETASLLLAQREQAVADVLATLPARDIQRLATLVTPVVVAEAQDEEELRRLCRMCDREACLPCPPWETLRTKG
jgi:DNA-binding MarR family transcriptional regulator